MHPCIQSVTQQTPLLHPPSRTETTSKVSQASNAQHSKMSEKVQEIVFYLPFPVSSYELREANCRTNQFQFRFCPNGGGDVMSQSKVLRPFFPVNVLEMFRKGLGWRVIQFQKKICLSFSFGFNWYELNLLKRILIIEHY